MALLVLCTARGAWARQHLISPGQSWGIVAERAQPGDEIILLPGMHQPAVLKNIAGEPTAPITIRAVDPRYPATIRQPTDGIRLIDCAHLVIRDIIIEDASESGITAVAARIALDASPADLNPPRAGHLTLQNVTIKRTGTADARSALHLDGLVTVQVTGCRFTGWTRAAIDIVACEDVSVRECTFTDDPLYDPPHAMRVRAGTDRVLIDDCTFRHVGHTTAIVLGGKSGDDDFDPPLEPLSSHDDATLAQITPIAEEGAAIRAVASSATLMSTARPIPKRFEASRCTINRCTFLEQPCPVLIAHADRCVVRNSSFVNTQRWVLAVLAPHGDDPRIAATSSAVFGQNLITWQAGTLTGALMLDERTANADLAIEENLWWSDELVEQRAKLVPSRPLPGFDEIAPQIVDVDPQLDAQHMARARDASLYGADSP